MASLTNEKLRATADKLIAAHEEASRSDDWLFFVDEIYAADCVYTCEYAGVMMVTANGIDEIKATHYGRDMQVGWEGWIFFFACSSWLPCVDMFTNTNQNKHHHSTTCMALRRASHAIYCNSQRFAGRCSSPAKSERSNSDRPNTQPWDLGILDFQTFEHWFRGQTGGDLFSDEPVDIFEAYINFEMLHRIGININNLG